MPIFIFTMSQLTEIDLNSWSRKEHFNFFNEFAQPYFNVCVSLNMKPLYQYCKSHSISFSSAYVHALGQAINDYEPMRIRIKDNKPVICETVEQSIVTLADDETFRFVTLSTEMTLEDFDKMLKIQKSVVHNEALFSERVTTNEKRLDVSHVSILPWLNFSAFSHATNFGKSTGIPKCVFGRYNAETGLTPLSIDVHHALMDGLHVANFVDKLQKKLDEIRVND
ncbi:CatA-like O-acetyltransferase [Pseudoalteromonas xiamenensis]